MTKLFTVLALIILLVAHPQPSHAAEVLLTPRIFLPLTMGGAGQASAPTPTPAPVGTDVDALRTETIRLINVERAKVGCPAATANATLTSAAQEWSDTIVARNIVAHSPTTWYTDHGYTPDASENIASGPQTAERVVALWMSDPPHRDTMLDCFRASRGYVYDIGIGAATGGGGNYRWTMALGDHLP